MHKLDVYSLWANEIFKYIYIYNSMWLVEIIHTSLLMISIQSRPVLKGVLSMGPRINRGEVTWGVINGGKLGKK